MLNWMNDMATHSSTRSTSRVSLASRAIVAGLAMSVLSVTGVTAEAQQPIAGPLERSSTATTSRVSLETLEQQLASGALAQRLNAVVQIGRLKSAAAPAIPTLIKSLKDTDCYVRQGAVIALGNIGPAARSATEDIVSALQDENANVRWGSLAALRKIDADAKDVLPHMANTLADANDNVRHEVAVLVAHAAEQSAKSGKPIPLDAVQMEGLATQLTQLVQHTSPQIRQDTVAAIRLLGPQAGADCQDALIAAVSDDSPEVRLEAIRAIQAFGPKAIEAAKPQLLKASTTDDPHVRMGASLVLKSVEPTNNEDVQLTRGEFLPPESSVAPPAPPVDDPVDRVTSVSSKDAQNPFASPIAKIPAEQPTKPKPIIDAVTLPEFAIVPVNSNPFAATDQNVPQPASFPRTPAAPRTDLAPALNPFTGAEPINISALNPAVTQDAPQVEVPAPPLAIAPTSDIGNQDARDMTSKDAHRQDASQVKRAVASRSESKTHQIVPTSGSSIGFRSTDISKVPDASPLAPNVPANRAWTKAGRRWETRHQVEPVDASASGFSRFADSGWPLWVLAGVSYIFIMTVVWTMLHWWNSDVVKDIHRLLAPLSFRAGNFEISLRGLLLLNYFVDTDFVDADAEKVESAATQPSVQNAGSSAQPATSADNVPAQANRVEPKASLPVVAQSVPLAVAKIRVAQNASKTTRPEQSADTTATTVEPATLDAFHQHVTDANAWATLDESRSNSDIAEATRDAVEQQPVDTRRRRTVAPGIAKPTAEAPRPQSIPQPTSQPRKPDVDKAVDQVAGAAQASLSVLKQALTSDNPRLRHRATETLARLCEHAVVGLRESSHDYQVLIRRRATAALHTVESVAAKTLMESFDDEDKLVRRSAVQVAPRDQETLLSVGYALEDEDVDVRRIASKTLANIGAGAATVESMLIDALHDVDAEVRCNAADALGSASPAAIPGLTDALQDDHPLVRANAAIALGHIGADAKTAVTALDRLIEDDIAEVRAAAITAIGDIGPDARIATTTLIQALNDTSVSVRRNAAVAIGRIGPDAKAALSVMSQLLDTDCVDVRRSLVVGLSGIGLAAVPTLTKALDDEDARVRQSAASALSGIGLAAVPTLMQTLGVSTSNPRTVERAEPVITQARRPGVEPNDDYSAIRMPTVAAMHPAVSRPTVTHPTDELPSSVSMSKTVRKTAGSSFPDTEELDSSADILPLQPHPLGEIGNVARSAVPSLIQSLRDDDPEVRWNAAAVLGGIGKESVDGLADALTHKDAEVRRNAAAALDRIGVDSAVAVPKLAVALRDIDTEVARYAASALGRIGAGAREAIDSLVTVLSHTDSEVRRNAAIALGNIGPESTDAITDLLELLHDEAPKVRAAADRALYKIGARAAA